MTLTKASAARSSPFFQIDIDPELSIKAKKHTPKLFQNRIVLTFTVDCIKDKNLQDLQTWMTSKWNEIPKDGKIAFINTTCGFLTKQTVILGESGFHVSKKVPLLKLHVFLHLFIKLTDNILFRSMTIFQEKYFSTCL